jgi:ribosomal protein L37AE/L43A
MQIASCPSCGASVKFRSAASVFAVCEYCTSTLTRRGADVEAIGRMAALQDDATLLQIGSTGVWKGVHFGVIGRIQLRYDAGLWNEWHVMFDDMRTGWLGEAAGEFYLTFEQKVPGNPPPFENLSVEDRVDINGRFFEVTNLESATCIAGEGELPFAVGPGYAAPVADLRLDDEFATLDYSEVEEGGGVRVYVGVKVAARELKLDNLRDPKTEPAAAAPALAADTFNCPSCAAPFALKNARSKTFGCLSCGAVVDTSNRQLKLVQKAQALDDAPLPLPLGSVGTFEDVPWEAIGYLRRASGQGFSWSETLLYNRASGYRWLVESDGHWSLVRNADKPLKKIGNMAIEGSRSHDHFAHYLAEVEEVRGECYWRVKAGDVVEVDDYIAPPFVASREKDDREVTWSIGEYLDPAAVQRAFGLKEPLAVPRGVAPNQPSPWAGTSTALWRRFALLIMLALALQLWFAITTQSVRNETVTLNPGTENNVLTQPFKLGGNGVLALSTQTDLVNAWAGIGYTLVDPASGRTWRAEQQLESYSGVDEDGDGWNEGSNSGLVNFGNVPAGTYQLQVEGELAPEAKAPLHAVLRLERGHASWFNWLLLQLSLLSIPVFGWWRARAFEAARWSDSDHAEEDDQ